MFFGALRSSNPQKDESYVCNRKSINSFFENHPHNILRQQDQTCSILISDFTLKNFFSHLEKPFGCAITPRWKNIPHRLQASGQYRTPCISPFLFSRYYTTIRLDTLGLNLKYIPENWKVGRLRQSWHFSQ